MSSSAAPLTAPAMRATPSAGTVRKRTLPSAPFTPAVPAVPRTLVVPVRVQALLFSLLSCVMSFINSPFPWSTGESSTEAENDHHLESDPGYDASDYTHNTKYSSALPDSLPPPRRHLKATEFLLNQVFDHSARGVVEENVRLKEEIVLLKAALESDRRKPEEDTASAGVRTAIALQQEKEKDSSAQLIAFQQVRWCNTTRVTTFIYSPLDPLYFIFNVELDRSFFFLMAGAVDGD